MNYYVSMGIVYALSNEANKAMVQSVGNKRNETTAADWLASHSNRRGVTDLGHALNVTDLCKEECLAIWRHPE